ncbi:toxic anion resistance protein [Candidatus Berkiella aquae]|uniref:Toxic anion resistance protein n=1 Tax=Candidatus Berkiella aquae TaxID=295108 RepID=A0A0Q9YDP9_9GAMM|nr:toxic anion resistance protein [Candidatus Berkiella aquae]MCS5709956.1 toxic anion resistance protein [Candidatus Berkiella aquae]
MENTDESQKLQLVSTQEVKQDLLLKEHVAPTEQQQIALTADEFVNALLANDLSQIESQQLSITKVENIGTDLQRQSAQQMNMLKQPISTLSRRAEDGGEVANALIDLKMTVESLDPEKVNFSPGWFSRLLGYIPGVGSSIKRYITKFESAQTVIDAIVHSLEAGRDQLLRDNITLGEDQKEFWKTSDQLEKTLVFANSVDQKLDAKSNALKSSDPSQGKIIDEYMLFPVRQRVIDLQQQLAVTQQSIVATELIIRNNKELVRGVNRALNVTITALRNATTIALALANQEKVLQKVEKINETTAKLIADSAKRLKTQGTQIHKGAASAQIDVNALKSALNDLKSAIDDISTFRQKALPEMANVIKDLDHLIQETAEPLKRIERQERKD